MKEPFPNQLSLPGPMGVLPGEAPDSPLLSYVPCPVTIHLSVHELHQGRLEPESPVPWSSPVLALPFWLRIAQQIRLGAYWPYGQRLTLPGGSKDTTEDVDKSLG